MSNVEHLACPCTMTWIGDVLPDPCPYHPHVSAGQWRPWPMGDYPLSPLQVEPVLSDEDVDRIARRVAELLRDYL